jgi:hypothetical protein
MGPTLGTVFFELRNECVMLHWKWQEFVTLFGTKTERIELLNDAAGLFFWIVQDTLWDDVLLRIARITDPPRSAGRDTLSLQRLPLLVATTFRGQVEALLQDCLTKCTFARDWRNRRIAHTDLVLAVQQMSATPLASASRQNVKDALHAIVKLLNAVQEHYARSESMYELHPPGNAESLLCVLRDGLQVEARRIERLDSGNWNPDDFDPPIPI